MVTQITPINLVPGTMIPRANISQYDTGARVLKFQVYNGESLFTFTNAMTVALVGTKPDNKGFTYEGTIENNQPTFDVTDQMSAVAGKVRAELIVYEDGERLGSGNFVIFVEEAALADDTDMSETDIAMIEQAVTAVGSMDSLKSYVANAVESMQVISGQTVIDPTLTVSGAAADAMVTGNLMIATGTMGDAANKKFGGNVSLTTPTGVLTISGTGVGSGTLTKIGNVYRMDGELLTTNTRVPLTGTALGYITSQPTYEKRPLWYVDDIPDFIVGHDYIATIITDGETTAAEPTFTLRTIDGVYSQSFYMNTVFTCTVKPQMVCMILKPGTYTNYRVFVTFTDLTATGGKYYVPEIFKTQLGTAITKVNTDINSTKTAGQYGTDIEDFVFITDVHWSANKQHSPGLIKRIIDETPIATVICGGDIVQAHETTKEAAAQELTEFTNVITEMPCYDYFCVFGNHDDNSNSNTDIATVMTKGEQFNKLYMPFAYRSNVHWIWDDDPTIYTEASIKNDYYLDHSRTHTRFLCLDWQNPVSTKRAAWVRSVMEKNDGYRVVVIFHGFYTVDSSGELVPEHDGFLTTLEPYKNKIAAMFTGHAHIDAVVDAYGDGTTPIIVTSCDTFRADRMTAGTLDEQCFDVVVIDYLNSKIELTRIGRGSNRTVQFTLS